MPDEIVLPFIRDRGRAGWAQGPTTLITGIGAPVGFGASGFGQISSAVPVPFGRGQIFVPGSISGFVSNNGTGNSNSAVLEGAFVQVSATFSAPPPNNPAAPLGTVIRNWLASFTGNQMIGSTSTVWQVDQADEISAAEIARSFGAYPNGLSVNVITNIQNSIALVQQFAIGIALVYSIRFIQE